MQVPIANIERVITSHWHSDHTGGLLSFLALLSVQQPTAGGRCIIDVHPDRPISRGIAPGPTYDKVLCALPPDPTFEQIDKAGGIVETHAEGHAVSGDSVWVSGEIPRVTDFEAGILGGVRWVLDGEPKTGNWVKEQVQTLVASLESSNLITHPSI